MKRQISTSIEFAILVAYSTIAILFFYNYGLPSLAGDIPLQMYSDSTVYEEWALSGIAAGNITLVGVGGNLLGPVLVLTVFNFDRNYIHFFNIAVMLLSYLIVRRNIPVNRLYLLLGLLSSPLLFFSLFGVNKEIFALLTAACLAVSIRKRTWGWVLATLAASILARWQLSVFVAVMFFATSVLNPFRAKRALTLAILVGAISIVYPIFSAGPLEQIDLISIEGAADRASIGASGTYEKMQSIQRSYGYFLVLIPKMLQLSFGLIPQISLVDVNDFWNEFVLPAQCISYAVLALAALLTRRLTVENDVVFLICMFMVFFVVTPVYAPRYLYPAAVLLAIFVSSHQSPKGTRRPVKGFLQGSSR